MQTRPHVLAGSSGQRGAPPHGCRVLITGASSGIGRGVAHEVARRGGTPVLVARSRDKLEAVRDEVAALGSDAPLHSCDLSNLEDIDALLEVLAGEPPVDILVNNAGRSIRRSLAHSCDRFHDFQRTMQLNYFGALRLTLGLLPGMRERRNGHIVNVSSAGVHVHTPRFAAYLASKAAFDEFSHVAATEVRGDKVHFTTVYMPLVRTPMIAPTKGYERVPALSPEQAANLVVDAMVHRPAHVMGPMTRLMRTAHNVAPRVTTLALQAVYRWSGKVGVGP